MATSSAPFQQGEPLNIDALNQLWNDARTSAASIAALSSKQAGLEGSLSQGIPVFDSGTIPSFAAAKSSGYTKPIKLTRINPATDTNITVVSTVNSDLSGAGDMISISTRGSGNSWTVDVTTGPSWSGNVGISWIAIAYRPI
jgi:hypothetical protein